MTEHLNRSAVQITETIGEGRVRCVVGSGKEAAARALMGFARPDWQFLNGRRPVLSDDPGVAQIISSTRDLAAARRVAGPDIGDQATRENVEAWLRHYCRRLDQALAWIGADRIQLEPQIVASELAADPRADRLHVSAYCGFGSTFPLTRSLREWLQLVADGQDGVRLSQVEMRWMADDENPNGGDLEPVLADGEDVLSYAKRVLA